jgi:hypothetical protein
MASDREPSRLLLRIAFACGPSAARKRVRVLRRYASALTGMVFFSAVIAGAVANALHQQRAYDERIGGIVLAAVARAFVNCAERSNEGYYWTRQIAKDRFTTFRMAIERATETTGRPMRVIDYETKIDPASPVRLTLISRNIDAPPEIFTRLQNCAGTAEQEGWRVRGQYRHYSWYNHLPGLRNF